MARAIQSGRERLQRALAAGVKIAAGSDSCLDLETPRGETAKQVLVTYDEAGMDSVDVLKAATINAAELLGMKNEIGVLRPGAFGDIIAVEENPLEDIHKTEQVRFVMKGGRVYLSRIHEGQSMRVPPSNFCEDRSASESSIFAALPD